MSQDIFIAIQPITGNDVYITPDASTIEEVNVNVQPFSGEEVYINVQPDTGAQLNIEVSPNVAGVQFVNGRDGIVTIDKTDVGLSNVENVSITGTSGYLQYQIDNLDLNYASQNEFNSLSGNLISTGANLQSQINSLYGSGFLTGLDLSPYYLKSNPSGFITGVDLSQYLTGVDLSPYVTKSGGQFIDRPTLNGTGFLLSGEAASLPKTIVYTTGNQTISGLKDFATRPTVNTIPVALSGEASSSIEQWVKNDSNTTLYKGQPVYVNGSNGNNILIRSASNSGESTSSKTFGLLKQTLLNNQQGYVVTEGPLSNVDTSMANEGDPIWLGPTGNLIYGLTNKPKAPQHLVYLGFVERAHQNQGKIFVKVQNGFELEELHNVRIVNEQNSDIIIYNSGSGLWLNSGVNFGSFYTKDNPSGFITGVDTSNFYTKDNPSGFIGNYNYKANVHYSKQYLRQESTLNDQELNSPLSGIKNEDIVNLYFSYPVDNGVRTTYSQTLKVNPGVLVDHNGATSSRNLIKFDDTTQYSGKAIRKVRYNSTIGNGYERINLTNLSSGENPAIIRPLTRRLETFYDISVPSGGGIRALYFNRPTSTDFVQGLCMNLRFNFEADSDPCVISGYSAGGLVFLLTGANYNFVQKERVILINKGVPPYYEFIHW